ncbi:MAG: ATP-binding cassette domain-containing protein, partial [Oscillospiraceae bacterium]|nr:ATP-binding cassette domain-containing protein [Oscillospiraceae bacterium]
MALLEVKNLSHSFGDKILYKNVDFELFKGEHMGLLGRNGTGKTTLLKSIIGNITPDSGDIKWQKNIKIGYLDQQAEINQSFTIFEYLKTAFADLYEIEEKLNKIYSNMGENFDDETADLASDYQNLLVNRGFYEIESIILKVANGLGISAIGIEKIINTLSGGQRAKVILAKILLEKPDVLLLDEPTNFLDKEHVEWLAEYLKNLDNAFILISHNFDFIDQVTNCILDIEFQRITKYYGNFTKFIEVKGLKRESYIRQFQAQQKEIKKNEDYIAKNRVRASTARQAQSRIKALEKIERLDPPQNTQKSHYVLKSLAVGSEKALKICNLEVGYEKVLLPRLTFDIKSGEKVVITGFNGIGKSTLLKTLMGKIPAISGQFKFADYVKIAYFEQDLNWTDLSLNPIEIVSKKFPKWSKQEVRNNLAKCGVIAKNATQKIGTLSGGEQAKVKLCILINTKSNF